jgi:hypothetical protein
MKKIIVTYMGKIFEVNISKENAFPNNLLKVEFENNPELLAVLESPIFIEEKKDLLSFTHIEVKNQDQIDLLGSIASGIVNQFYVVE